MLYHCWSNRSNNVTNRISSSSSLLAAKVLAQVTIRLVVVVVVVVALLTACRKVVSGGSITTTKSYSSLSPSPRRTVIKTTTTTTRATTRAQANDNILLLPRRKLVSAFCFVSSSSSNRQRSITTTGSRRRIAFSSSSSSSLIRSSYYNKRLLYNSWTSIVPSLSSNKNHVELFGITPKTTSVKQQQQQQQQSTTIISNNINNNYNNGTNITTTTTKRIPSVQRIDGPRPARRLNHAFKYLYRYNANNCTADATTTNRQNNANNNNNATTTLPSVEYYETYNKIGYYTNVIGYTIDQINVIQKQYPKLVHLSIIEQIFPKYQFIVSTLCQQNTTRINSFTNLIRTNQLKYIPNYFGIKLEKIIAPRHAFLDWYQLASYYELLEIKSQSSTTIKTTTSTHTPLLLFDEFILSCTSTKKFLIMCQQWEKLYGTRTKRPMTEKLTIKHIEAFETLFSKGIMACVRNEIVQVNNTWTRQYIPESYLSTGQLTNLLLSHGVSYKERDYRGVTLFHWAAGCNNIDSLQVLINHYYCNNDTTTTTTATDSMVPPVYTITTTRENATLLHWASAGSTGHEFGTGGHLPICKYIIDLVPANNEQDLYGLINAQTNDGNTASMWAAWSGSMDVLQYLALDQNADLSVRNHNGCSIAHWAASGGNIQVCQFLANTMNVSFHNNVTNYNGNTPLSHAIAFGRTDVVEWILSTAPQSTMTSDTISPTMPTDAIATTATQQLYNGNDESSSIDHDATTTISNEAVKNLARNFVQWTDGKDENRKEILQLLEDEWGL